MLRAVREVGDVFPALFVDDQDVVLAIPARARTAFRDHDHRFDGHHHARLQYRVDIFAQLQPGFATIVMAQGAKGVTIPEGAVLQQVVLHENFIELQGYVRALDAGLDQLQTGLVNLDVDLPQAQVLVRAMVEKQGALQRRVVTGNHREAVKAEDIALVHLAAGDRVVRAVGVDPRLEPGPGVHQFGVREGTGNFAHHRLGGMQRHFIFGHLVAQGLDDGRATDIGNPCAVADDRMFFRRLDHAHAHARRGNIHKFGLGVAAGELVAIEQVHMVELDTDAPRLGQRLLDGDKVVVALPVGVHDVVGAHCAAPRLATVDIGADGHGAVLGHHQRVVATKRAIQEIAVVVEVVVRGEHRGIDIVLRHIRPQLALAVGVLLGRECRSDFFAVLDLDGFRHLHGMYPCH